MNEEKARTVCNHGAYIFVSDEVYNDRKYLQEMKGVYKASDFTAELLRVL